ncbi:MAG: hypothetical protein HOY71_03965, partial [Nonomuraea sp.]|nr:hypothetical protein [Nonomuraea sp.]
PVVLAPQYQDAKGLSTVKRVDLHPAGLPDVDVELLEEVVKAVDEAAPGVLANDTELWRALTNAYSTDTWLGKIDDLLDPDSPPARFVIRPTRMMDPGTVLEVTVRAELSDEASFRDEIFDHGQIKQDYSMLEENSSESASLTGSPDLKAGIEGMFNLEATTDRGQTSSGASGMQETRVQRFASFAGAEAEVRQGIKLVVEVRRSPGTQTLPETVTREVSGTIDRIIPSGMSARPGEAPTPTPAAPDPRPLPAPELFGVESTRVRDLVKNIREAVRNHKHGRELTEEEAHDLARILTGSFRNALFQRMTDSTGLMVMPIRLSRGRTMNIYVHAGLFEPTVLVASNPGTEIGQVDRRQWSLRTGAERTQMVPLGGSIDGDRPMVVDEGRPEGTIKVNLSGSVNEQASDSSGVSGGNRDETSVFEKPDGTSTVRFRVDYDVRLEVNEDKPKDATAERQPAPRQHVGTGTADLIMGDDALQDMMDRAENPPPVPQAQQPKVQNVPGRPESLADLHARNATFDEIVAELSTRRGPINLQADPAVPPYGQLNEARLISRALQQDVHVTIQTRYGVTQDYIATPDGDLHAQTDDRQFGARFSGVPTALVTLAETHGIDLHLLHERTRTLNGTLAEHLRRELARQGIANPTRTTEIWPVKATPDDASWTGGSYQTATHGSPLPGTRFVADGRPEQDADLTVAEAKAAVEGDQIAQDMEGVQEITWVSEDTVRVVHADLGEMFFKVGVGPVEGPYLGQTTVTGVTGTATDPFPMTLGPRVAADQVARLVLHEISDVIQHRAEGGHHHHHTHSAEEAARNECVTGRRNELRYLQRKLAEAAAAGDVDAQRAFAQEIDAVEDDLADRTGIPRRNTLDSLLNWGDTTELEDFSDAGVVGRARPLGTGVYSVNLSDGSPSLLLTHGTRGERDMQLLAARLAARLGLIGEPRPAGDRHILIDPPRQAAAVDPGAFRGSREDVLMQYLVRLLDMTPLVTRPGLFVAPSGTSNDQLFFRVGTNGSLGWASNPLSLSDVEQLGTLLEGLRPEFARRGQLAEYGRLMTQHRYVAQNAAGVQSVLAAAPGQSIDFADPARLRQADAVRQSTWAGFGPVRSSGQINPQDRFRENLQQDVVAYRDTPMGRVVTFADGSQALRLPLSMSSEAIVQALLRQALRLQGPALQMDSKMGYVYVSYGSDELRTSAATGIRQVVTGLGFTGGSDLVLFNDGRWAVRHVLP